MAVSLTTQGAPGETFDEMLGVLCPGARTLSDLNSLYGKLAGELPLADGKTTVAIANSVWYAEDFSVSLSFTRMLAEEYLATVSAFGLGNRAGVASLVNAWISDATRGNITGMLKEDQVSALMIVNALYFKSEWAKKFDKRNTKTGTFTNIDFSPASVPFMHGSMNGAYGKIGNVEVASLPFGNGAFEMVVVLPERGVAPDDALDALQASGGVEDLNGVELRLSMPSFKVRAQLDLVPAYKALGIRRAFGSDAEFGNMGNVAANIGLLMQECCIEVNEEGAEASAATVNGFVTSSGNVVDLILDHPFAYLIRESSTGTILFMGAVNRL